LETGQETAEELIEFIDAVDRGNLFVNFDPANMILYGTGEPLQAMRQLSQRIRSVHCKDAKWSTAPGKEWGQEVPLGDGDVNFPAFLRTLLEIGYAGPLTIEREIPHLPQQQLLEIGQAVARLTTWQAELHS
jgi:sugar phosphate isomerase/epimerase